MIFPSHPRLPIPANDYSNPAELEGERMKSNVRNVLVVVTVLVSCFACIGLYMFMLNVRTAAVMTPTSTPAPTNVCEATKQQLQIKDCDPYTIQKRLQNIAPEIYKDQESLTNKELIYSWTDLYNSLKEDWGQNDISLRRYQGSLAAYHAMEEKESSDSSWVLAVSLLVLFLVGVGVSKIFKKQSKLVKALLVAMIAGAILAIWLLVEGVPIGDAIIGLIVGLVVNFIIQYFFIFLAKEFWGTLSGKVWVAKAFGVFVSPIVILVGIYIGMTGVIGQDPPSMMSEPVFVFFLCISGLIVAAVPSFEGK